MHTVKVIGIGFALLVVCLVVGRMMGGVGGAGHAIARAALVFLGLWLIGSGINMWIGVSRAGYSVSEEAPIFFVVFGVPAAVALLVWWRYSRT